MKYPIDFSEKMNMEIIPWVQTMIKRERDHLEYLEKNKHVPGVAGMIASTNDMIAHFEMRLAEYRAKYPNEKYENKNIRV